MLTYCKNLHDLHLPTICEKFNLTPAEATQELCQIWHKLSLQVEDNLIRTNYREGSWYYEVCDTVYQRGKTIPASAYIGYCRANRTSDQHISVYAHDEVWKNYVERNGRVSGEKNSKVRLDVLWLELDRKDYFGNADLDKAMNDAIRIKLNFPYPEHMWIFTSGNASAHIAVNAALFGNPIVNRKQCGRNGVFYRLVHKIVGDVRHNNGIEDVYDTSSEKLFESYKQLYPDHHILYVDEAKQWLNGADQLTKQEIDTLLRQQFEDTALYDRQTLQRSMENTDPNIYSRNSVIRQPFSLHEKTMAPKKLLDGEQEFRLESVPPLLLHWYYECYKKPIKRKSLDKQYDSTYIIQVFSEVFENFDPNDADANGWVRDLYNPLYCDTNPSVAVNIDSGWIHDFGDTGFSMSLEQFLTKIKPQCL